MLAVPLDAPLLGKCETSLAHLVERFKNDADASYEDTSDISLYFKINKANIYRLQCVKRDE